MGPPLDGVDRNTLPKWEADIQFLASAIGKASPVG